MKARNGRLKWTIAGGVVSMPLICIIDALAGLAESGFGALLMQLLFYTGIAAVVVPPAFLQATVSKKLGVFLIGVVAYLAVVALAFIIALNTGYIHLDC